MIDGLDTQDVRDEKGVGGCVAEKKLAKLQLNTVTRLAVSFAIRYQDRTRVVPMANFTLARSRH